MSLEDLSYADPADPDWKRWLIRSVEHLSGRPRFIRRYGDTYLDWSTRIYGRSPRVWSDAMDRIGVVRRLHGESWPPAIPRETPVIIVANHPFGVMDGMAIMALAEQLDRPFRILLHSTLLKFPELRPYGLPVDFEENRAAMVTNLNTRKEALARLAAGEVIVIFPAGGVATASAPLGKAEDLPWKRFTARLIHSAKATVAPIYFAGQNGPLFHLVSRFSQPLRLSLMSAEFFRNCGKPLDIHIGKPIPYEELADMADRSQLMQHLREQVFALEPPTHQQYPRRLRLKRRLAIQPAGGDHPPQ